ncbi:MAG: Ni-sirohydrochlorin a,c-diamide synthase [Methanomicrobiales archaeon]|jgi:cobyrinic acid a,c-diamide synthase|nr:Ni-sirohydrochlorin a,c-diamide synthase [Methanomicrobiales archaeon]
MTSINIRTLLIAGDRSGSGKTSITTSIAAALAKKYVVQTFKVGMDYIDPSYLTAATGRPCRNLDSFLMTDEEVRDVFTHACDGADIALIEGVRGLYEGADAILDTGSTAGIAKILDVPIILVINTRSITRSAAALVMGFQAFDPQIQIVGVILNNVQGKHHIQKTKEAIEHFCNIPVFGAIPRTETPDLVMRHLGLVPYVEAAATDTALTISDLSARFLPYLHIDEIESHARKISVPIPLSSAFTDGISKKCAHTRIAVAHDKAFNFYYPDLFDILRANGAEIQFFSPLHDVFEKVANADGFIFGGGYPEYYAADLAKNESMRRGLQRAAKMGVPIYAECGGLIYLASSLEIGSDFQGLTQGEKYSLCDIVHGIVTIPVQRTVRYVVGETSTHCPFGKHRIFGHVFHYSAIEPTDPQYGIKLERGVGIDGSHDGLVVSSVMAGYTHLHPVPSISFFQAFIERCKSASQKR